MQNRDALKASAVDGDNDEMLGLLEAWWHAVGSKTVFVKGRDDKEISLIAIAEASDLTSLPVRKARNMDGDMTYDSRGFGDFLRKYKGRVYTLEDGTSVTMERSDKRTSQGYGWSLQPTAKTPIGNVS